MSQAANKIRLIIAEIKEIKKEHKSSETHFDDATLALAAAVISMEK